MKEPHIDSYLPEFISGELSEAEEREIRNHLKKCDTCRLEMEQLIELDQLFKKDSFQKPSPDFQQRFEVILKEEKRAQTRMRNQMRSTKWSMVGKIAAGFSLILGGYFLGKISQEPSSIQPTEVVETTTNSEENNMLALMTNTSASKRIKAVYAMEKFEKPNDEIIKALITRMRSDENVNVRMAAIEALGTFLDSELVKEAFIDVLETEKEPVAQISLINFLAKIQEQRALDSMRKLLYSEETSDVVKEQLQRILPNQV